MNSDSENSFEDENEKKEETIMTYSPGKDSGNEKSRLKKKSKKKSPYQNLIVNLAETKYAVVKKVTKTIMGMKIIRDSSSQDWDLYWTDNAVTSEQVGKMKPYQKINHFPGMFTLSRKNYLARNLIKMEKNFPSQYSFFPKTWVLPSELSDLRLYLENDPNAVVIAKPQASCQGKGIFLSKSIDDFEFGEQYVVQKYTKKPFLIDSLKFDLRVYVLIAGCDPLRVYVYKQGLARFATEPYSAPKKDNLNNLFMHLTNYAINKNSEKFEFNSDKNEMDKGHKRSLTSTLKKIKQLGHNEVKVWEEIKDCISKTLISAQPLLSHHYRSCQSQNYSNNMCFQILGFDVLLDHKLRPQILQVNYTPSFSTDTPLDKEIKQNLILESLILMNLTSKAKNEIINEKKREMQERTLTGKKVYHSREEKQEIVSNLQKIRDIWEDKNIGNFERALPLREGDTKMEEYEDFLTYSVECYHQNTGANVKRNNKVIPSQSAGNGINMVVEENKILQQTNNSNQIITTANQREVQQIYNQPTKFTNPENLQKIYKTKFRPMLYKRPVASKKESEKTEEREREKETIMSIKDPEGHNKETIKKEESFNPYKTVTKTSINRITGISNPKQAKNSEISKIMTAKPRTMASVKKGLSTVYNITFQQK